MEVRDELPTTRQQADACVVDARRRGGCCAVRRCGRPAHRAVGGRGRGHRNRRGVGCPPVAPLRRRGPPRPAAAPQLSCTPVVPAARNGTSLARTSGSGPPIGTNDGDADRSTTRVTLPVGVTASTTLAGCVDRQYDGHLGQALRCAAGPT